MLAHRITTMTTLPTLDDVTATDAAQCGHKAATLARLRQAGLDVPAGFVLPLDVAADPAAIDAALAGLPGPVAVRSSAAAEDGPDASFAGQFDTTLSVEGTEAVLAAIEQCRASAHSERVDAYGRDAGGVAVLVQRMVPADAAGVAFSANPVTGDRDEVRISAVSGLGDRLVGGEVDGDEWSVRGDVPQAIASPHGVLDATTARRVATLARDLEVRLGAPQDVEWALVGDRLVVLQARPITALPVEPTIEVPKGTWQKDTGHYPGPITPLGEVALAAYERALAGIGEQWGLLPDGMTNRAIGHEVYSHIEPDDGGKDPPPWWVLGLVVRLIPSLRRKLRRAREAIESGRLDATPRRWEAEWRPAIKREIERLAGCELASLDDASLQAHWGEIEALLDRAMTIHFELLIPYLVRLHELIELCRAELSWSEAETMTLLQGLSTTSSAPTRELAEIATLARERPAARAVIEQGGPAFVRRLRGVDPEVARRVDAYLDRWGLRTINYDAGTPTLREQPALVASLLADLLDPPPSRDLAAARQEAVARAHGALAQPDARRRFDEALGRAEVVYPLREDNVLYTDNLVHGLVRQYALEIGRRLRQRGRLRRDSDAAHLRIDELHAALRGELADPAEVASRVRGELSWVRANPGPATYGPTPGKMPDLRGLPEPARRLNGAMLWAVQTELVPPAASRGDSVGGHPASPGVARGRVRIIRDASRIHCVRPGDIVVCPTTTPAWTVMFQRAAAIVTDGGSVLSHAAIVAREHGIAAVVATGNGTSRLRDGQEVIVDGTRGIVTVVQGS